MRALLAVSLIPCACGVSARHHVDELPNDGTRAWRELEQGPSNGRNLCISGHQVPDFYVLGVQKCATTSLAMDLMAAGIANVHGEKNPKEFHWFDHRMNFSLGDNGVVENRRSFLRWMPACPRAGLAQLRGAVPRQALADFTPDYLRLVPRPTDLKPQGEWLGVFTKNFSMPLELQRLYGLVLAPRLRFAVVLRRPLMQMQSAWYHARSFKFRNGCTSCKAPSFRDALTALVTGLEASPPRYNAWLWTVLYARHLEVWFEHFKPSQFQVIPAEVYTNSLYKDGVCRSISQHIDFHMDCDSRGQKPTHTWSHPHPSLFDDAPQELRTRFGRFMDKERLRLVGLLATSEARGLSLAGYRGESGSQDAVEKWLSMNW